MKVLCIGHASYDISCMMQDFPKENSKYSVTEKIEGGGGEAANGACLLAKWGVETYLAAAIGADSNGDKIKKELEMFGVKNDFLETVYDKNTSLSFVVSNKKNGSRTIINLAAPDSTPHIKKEDNILVDPDLILIDGYEYHASNSIINRYPNAIKVGSANNLLPEIVELCSHCNYIICSKEFAENFTNIKIDYNNTLTLVNIYHKLKERFNKNEVIVTLEDQGAMYASNNQIKVMPGLKVNAKDTTGAGDAFHAAFSYSILHKYDLEKAITYANIAAGLCCENVGGKVSFPNLNAVLSQYNSKIGVENVIPASASNFN